MIFGESAPIPQEKYPDLFYNFSMSEINFFHCLLDKDADEIYKIVDEYFSSTNYQAMMDEGFSIIAFKRKGLKFSWRLDPIQLNLEDMGLESEVVIKSRDKNGEKITEIKISFTDEILLELYFEELVYKLLESTSIIEGRRSLPILKGKPRFSNLYEYNLYRIKRENQRYADYKQAMADLSTGGDSPITSMVDHEEGDSLILLTDKDSERIISNNQFPGLQIGTDEYGEITAIELVKRKEIYDIEKMKELSGYHSYKSHVMKLVIFEVPKKYKIWSSSRSTKWSSGLLEVGNLGATTISRYIRGLYRLGVRSINGAPLPYTPR